MSFKTNFTAAQLALMLPSNKETESWFTHLEQNLPDFGIDTPRRIAAYIAQCSHESGEFRILQENLNYSDQGLQSVFKKYFPTQESTVGYARQPQMIANKVYADRNGNGPEDTGDGWNFRGRGLIQLTGKDNYEKASQSIFQDKRWLENPDMVAEKSGAVLSACWFWKMNNLNILADAGKIDDITRKINGGLNGQAQRLDNYIKCCKILGIL